MRKSDRKDIVLISLLALLAFMFCVGTAFAQQLRTVACKSAENAAVIIDVSIDKNDAASDEVLTDFAKRGLCGLLVITISSEPQPLYVREHKGQRYMVVAVQGGGNIFYAIIVATPKSERV